MSEQALWTPSLERLVGANLTAFSGQLAARHPELGSADYFDFHRWCVAHPEIFWSEVWRFCGVVGDQGERVLEEGERFPGARWFPDAQLNFAENLLRFRDDRIALISYLENGDRRMLSYAKLYREVAKLASGLRRLGVGPGDRVAGFMPNVTETVVAMLAATSLGATWSSCSPDFGINGVLDRFGQIQPKVLFVCEGYIYNGKDCDTRERVAGIAAEIDTLQHIIVVPVISPSPDISAIARSRLYESVLDPNAGDIEFYRGGFDHPLYIMYSSGTTGVPKCIVHSAGGTLLQHLKEHQLMCDLKRDDIFFYFTTCGWMMWNWLLSGLATGATLVLYDGSPLARNGRLLIDYIDQEEISIFGASAKYITALQKNGLKPRQTHRLSSLKTILSTGSPLSHESFDYVYRDFKEDVCLSSISGGTDIISCFVGGSVTLPVYKGEIQAPGLGLAVDIWDEKGQALPQGKGELVCTRPFPSCPIGFWDDPDGKRFHDAYFARFEGVWAHGDYGEITPHRGYIIHGRSDAVLNPGGVRIGTAEIYRQVEKIDVVLDSVVIGQQWEDDVRVILFIVLRDGQTLDEKLAQEIRDTIRRNTTPRHVPAKILQVADIPRTISGKIAELAVRSAVHGEAVKNSDALANPEALALFRDLPALQS